ncbi:MAG: UDP-glucose/GDP-mannose dehydrogenase family protein [Candidatus Peregrinibacteria bacterium]|nr:UDP-glucose/GDP-mannose dehydrogenase family protein [Candidatus Peregrinibacteria bacterium]MDZ4245467.1 UDP-glucose/GDP-mannose dehydrogenase family protein [Candidatus Gracilibacteria bacterium]
MTKNITIIGTGYIGLVTGVCLAELGNNVTCVDISEEKIKKLKNGESPIFEPGLPELIAKNKSRLKFTTSYAEGLEGADLIYIAVHTPSKPSGEADLKYVFAAAKEIGENLKIDAIIVNKSTVPVGTGHKVEKVIQKETDKKVSVISCPEFLREGKAIYDFFHPYRIVIGADTGHEKAVATLKDLYKDVVNSHAEYIITDLRSAEMIKYASNSILATQISFINELSHLCEKVGVDVTEVARGMKLDERIGKDAFLNAGLGFGGSCFPKDVRALIALGKQQNARLNLLEQTEKINERQIEKSFSKIKKILKEANVNFKDAKIVMLGLSFKPNTDDTRESQTFKLIDILLKNGAKEIHIIDPIVSIDEEIHREKFLPKRIRGNKKELDKLHGFTDGNIQEQIVKAATNADLIILATEWGDFTSLDFASLGALMRNKCFVDLRNIYTKNALEKHGFTLKNMGRK